MRARVNGIYICGEITQSRKYHLNLSTKYIAYFLFKPPYFFPKIPEQFVTGPTAYTWWTLSAARSFTLPRPTSDRSAGYMAGGGNLPYNPQPAAGGGVTPLYNPPPAAGGGVTRLYKFPSAAGGGNMLKNLDTNVTGTGISARPEEFGAVGSRLHSGQGGATAQGYGATGGYDGAIRGGAAPGIIGGIASSGVIVGMVVLLVQDSYKLEYLTTADGRLFFLCYNEKLENFCSNCYEDYYGMKAPDGTAP